VAIAREIGWRSGEAFAILDSSYCFHAVGNFGRSLQSIRESLRIAEEIDHKQWQAGGRFSLGAVGFDFGVYDACERQLVRAVELANEVGTSYWLQLITLTLARCYSLQGDHARAEAIVDGIHSQDDLSGSWFSRLGWMSRTELALDVGDPEAALCSLDRLESSFAERSRAPNARLLMLRGRVLTAFGRHEEAIAFLTEAEEVARRRQARALLWRIDVALGQAELGRSSRTAAAEAFTRARSVVAEIADTMSDEPIPELGISAARTRFIAATDDLMPARRPPTALKAAKQSYDGLTARERDVAKLITMGMSNRAIADELIVSERTVASHVANILSKLEFSSRSQIAVWATEKGLNPKSTTASS
jgi:ATP/maltotriose-dependent transcriptional regulator MalT